MKKDRHTFERRRKEKQRNIRLTEDERLQHFIYELQVVPSILNVKGNVSRDFRYFFFSSILRILASDKTAKIISNYFVLPDFYLFYSLRCLAGNTIILCVNTPTLGVKVQLILAALYQRNCKKTSEMPTFSCNWIFHKLVNISITLDHAHITVIAQSTPWSQNVRA